MKSRTCSANEVSITRDVIPNNFRSVRLLKYASYLILSQDHFNFKISYNDHARFILVTNFDADVCIDL